MGESAVQSLCVQVSVGIYVEFVIIYVLVDTMYITEPWLVFMDIISLASLYLFAWIDFSYQTRSCRTHKPDLSCGCR